MVKTVGVRELKNKLSQYLRLVRSGDSVLVTDRGEVVAEITTPGISTDASVPPGLAALARGGLASLGAPSDDDLYPALPRRRRRRRRTAAQLLEDERQGR
jgi:prevent-host-death family protein